MKLSLTLNCWVDEDLMFAQQFGADQVVAQAVLPEGRAWDARLLAGLRNRVEKSGLSLAGMDRLPVQLDRAIAGIAGRDEEIASVCRFIDETGQAGIPLVGYEWAPARSRPARQPAGRGGASVSSCRGAPPAWPGEAWDHLRYFLERVVPVAEAAGVRLAGRPGDPFAGGPVGSTAALQRLIEAVPSPCHGLDFWQGTLALMPGADLAEAIRFFGQRQKIFLVTLSNPHGRLPSCAEAFLDEGDTQVLRSLQLYREAGFAGPLRPGPQPGMADDTEWGHKSQAFAVGYLRALLQVVAGPLKRGTP